MGIYLSKVNFSYNLPRKKKQTIKLTLKSVNIDINTSDEFIALVGHTGSGKSTLVQLMNALLLPIDGKVNVNGIEITNKTKVKLKNVRKSVGLVFQFPEYQIFEETVLKDIMFGPKNFGIFNPMEKAKEAAKVMEIEDLLDKSPFNLSGGQMRKVAIAGILASSPDVLILDEPTVGLDPLAKIELLNFLKDLNNNYHKTIIVITHDMEVVSKYAKRAIVLNHGEVKFDGPKEELFKSEEIIKNYDLAYPEIMNILKMLNSKLNLNLDINKYNVDEAIEELLDKVGEENE